METDNTKQQESSGLQVLLFTAEQISAKVRELAYRINEDYRTSPNLVLIGVLKGAAVFLSDLMRALQVPAEVDFIRVSSYGSATASSGKVTILSDVTIPLGGKDVLVVEGIVDSGLTLGRILEHLASKAPLRSLEVCSLLSKAAKSSPGVKPKYVGFEIEDEFVVGYGLDLAERYRNLPHIAALR